MLQGQGGAGWGGSWNRKQWILLKKRGNISGNGIHWVLRNGFFKIKKITCMLNVCAFVHMAACACGGRKRAQYLLELELHGVMSCLR